MSSSLLPFPSRSVVCAITFIGITRGIIVPFLCYYSPFEMGYIPLFIMGLRRGIVLSPFLFVFVLRRYVVCRFLILRRYVLRRYVVCRHFNINDRHRCISSKMERAKAFANF